jgi:hypothetical protein
VPGKAGVRPLPAPAAPGVADKPDPVLFRIATLPSLTKIAGPAAAPPLRRCCSLARVCLDRRSETQIFVDPGAFMRTNLRGQSDSSPEILRPGSHVVLAMAD